MIEPGDGRWRWASLDDYHNGQMVKPLVKYRRMGLGYQVRYRMHDSSDQADPGDETWVEILGDYHEVQRHLRAAGIRTDDHEF